MKRSYTVIIEKDEDGVYVAEVPSLRSCYTQGKTVEEAMGRIREVIRLCEKDQDAGSMEFIGLQRVDIPA